MQLSIIIISYNVKFFLEQCLCSVSKAIEGIDAEIVVVDNCSSDKSVEYLQPFFPQVHFIKSETNLGFAKANNLALKKSKGEFVLFLNPDTIVGENVLHTSIDFLKNNANAGAAGVRMIDGSGKFLPESKRSFPSASASFYKMIGFAKLFPASKVFNKYALGNIDEKKVSEVDVLSGAYFMARKNVLDQFNGFDEDYFMYGEDVDLSYRIQKLGYKNFYLGNLCILHFKGESAAKKTVFSVKHFYKAMIIFVRKNYGLQKTSIKKAGLYAAIYFAWFLALLSLPVKLLLQYKPFKSADDYYLIGDDNCVQEARNILEKNKINPAEIAATILEKVALQSRNTIIFCNGLQFINSLAQMNTGKFKAKFMWHGKATNSIVGSANKNQAGEVFSNSR